MSSTGENAIPQKAFGTLPVFAKWQNRSDLFCHKRVCQEVHKHTHSRNVLLPVDVVVDRVNKLLKGWGEFYSVGYPSRVFRKVNHYVLKRMARFLNRKSQRYYRLKFADTYYGEMTHYGLYRLAWADVRRAR